MGFLLVFDLTSEASFLNVRNWIGEIQTNAYSENVDMILVGNKSDLEHERIIPKSRAQEFAQQNQVEYIETSALLNMNVAESVELLLDLVMNRIEGDQKFSGKPLRLPKPSTEKLINPSSQGNSTNNGNSRVFCCNY